MNKIISFCFFFLLLCVQNLAAQTIDAGISKSRYIYAAFTFANKIGLSISQSVSSENFKHQQIEAGIRYSGIINKLEYKAGVFAASAWNSSYQRYYAKLSLDYLPLNFMKVTGQIAPLYDTGYKYNTCFSAGLAFKPAKPLWINLKYTTIPDYRKSEKRIHAGINLHSGPLEVSGTVSIPATGDQKFKTWRLLLGFNYTIELKHKSSPTSLSEI